jgi:hypothetical protein
MRIKKEVTIECSEKEMETVGNFIDFLENIDDDDWNDVMDILGKDIYDRVEDFYRLMKVVKGI